MLAAAPHPNPLPVRAETRDGERGQRHARGEGLPWFAEKLARGQAGARMGGRVSLAARGPLSPFVFTNGERVGVRGGHGTKRVPDRLDGSIPERVELALAGPGHEAYCRAAGFRPRLRCRSIIASSTSRKVPKIEVQRYV